MPDLHGKSGYHQAAVVLAATREKWRAEMDCPSCSIPVAGSCGSAHEADVQNIQQYVKILSRETQRQMRRRVVPSSQFGDVVTSINPITSLCSVCWSKSSGV